MAYPILATQNTWYKSNVERTAFTQINIVDSYTPTNSESDSWNADSNDSGSIRCYVIDTTLIIAGDGSGKIALSQNAMGTFSGMGEADFSNVSSINGCNIFDTSNVTNMYGMFYGLSSLTYIDINSWNTSAVTTMAAMFASCTSINELNISDWDVGNVENMKAMFQECSSLNKIPIDSWNTESLFQMSHLFYGCSSLTSYPIENWNMSNVADINHACCDCVNVVSADFSNWDTSNIQSAYALFNDCRNLKTVNLSGWNTSKFNSFAQMFERCYNLTEIIGLDGFDTTCAINDAGSRFDEMFLDCRSLTELDLSSFDSATADSMVDMFTGMNSLRKIKLGNKFSFTGSGSTALTTLPTPNATYISGADGYWYNSETATAYAPADVPSNTAATYLAVPAELTCETLIKYGTLVKIADAIRAKNGSADKYTPAEMIVAIGELNIIEANPNLWNISDRTYNEVTWVTPTGTLEVDYGTYSYGVAHSGYWNSGHAGTLIINDKNSITLTATNSSYGIALPYDLEVGETYKFSCVSDATAAVRYIYYDDSGIFQNGGVYAATSSGVISHEFTVEDYAHFILLITTDANVATTISDIDFRVA